jgi:adenylate cyclase
MDGALTLDEVADRAGVAPGFAGELLSSGVIELREDGRGFGPGAVRRAMLVSACVEAGLPLTGIAEAIRSGHLSLTPVDAPYYDRWGDRGDQTWEQLSASSGASMAFIRRMYEALGWAPPEPEDRPPHDEPALLKAMSLALGAGFEEEALLRLCRVYGESLRRITRTETEMWHEYVDVPLQRQGSSQRQILEAGRAFGEAIMSLIDGSLLTLYHRMQEHAWMQDLVEHIELALVEAGVYKKPERPVAMAFMDITGYTALTEERGDQAAAELATALSTILQRTAAQRGGEAMKWLGDGVMFRFREPAEGVHGAVEAVEATVPAGLPPARVGMHVGAVVQRDGDVFGRTVNLASRISGVAGPGEVLVTLDTIDPATVDLVLLPGSTGDTRCGKVVSGRTDRRAEPA